MLIECQSQYHSVLKKDKYTLDGFAIEKLQWKLIHLRNRPRDQSQQVQVRHDVFVYVQHHLLHLLSACQKRWRGGVLPVKARLLDDLQRPRAGHVTVRVAVDAVWSLTVLLPTCK